jgi:hypothetical protein
MSGRAATKTGFSGNRSKKTFSTASTTPRILHRPCAAPLAKVFWFFFSKKNRFLSQNPSVETAAACTAEYVRSAGFKVFESKNGN